jgi:hypothetical protein
LSSAKNSYIQTHKENGDGMPKVLFICKKRQTEYGVSYGLINSCKFLCNALERLGIEGKVVAVVDNNCIDKEVHQYQPTHVFIEALWVVPDKFKVLLKLYPKIQWYVRLHSNTPFIANEGMAIQWILGYEEVRKEFPNLHVAANSDRFVRDLWLARKIPVAYAPNAYDPDRYAETTYKKVVIDHSQNILNIGCFGAIRPMKNTLIQAMAAMGFADKIGKTLHFHVNGRCEQNGESIHRNLRFLFDGTKHKLVGHPWCDHPEFISLVKEMDLGMQISFSETFNIVAADMVTANVPLIGSDEIGWLSTLYRASTNDIDDIIRYLYLAHYGKKINLQILNKIGLDVYNWKATSAWVKLLCE